MDIDRKEDDLEKIEDFQVEEKIDTKEDSKNLFLTIAVLFGIFILIFGGVTWYMSFSDDPLTLDGMHQKNYQGDLDESQGYVYNGFSFVYAEGLWWTDVQVVGKIVRIPLHFGPKELEYIEIEGNVDAEFNKGGEIYVAIDPLTINKFYTLGISELSFNMVKGIGREPVGSCTKEHPACDNRTIVSCENNPGKPVVELAIDTGTKIEVSDMCIKVSGQDMEFVKAVDRLLYKWYGVMD